ncbi:transposase [Paraburkholderia sp. RAU6.4a]
MIAVALEPARGPIVSALQKYDFLVLFPINPSTLAKYREAFKPSRAKDDPTDAELALDLLLRHPERFAPLRPQGAAMRSLMSLIEQRREMVGDKTRFTNRLCNTLDPGILSPCRLHALALVAQLRMALAGIDVFDREIATVARTLPDFALFECLPGAGPHLTPRLLAAFGEQRERFRHAAELQKYSGIAPVTERSGKKCWVHWRWQCPTFLRQTFVEWAGQTINKSFWAGAYYRQQRAKGSSYQAAVRALAFKWIRILYRCWQTRTLYDESVYLNALRKRGSPLLGSLALPPRNT